MRVGMRLIAFLQTERLSEGRLPRPRSNHVRLSMSGDEGTVSDDRDYRDE